MVPIEADILKVDSDLRFPVYQMGDGSGRYVLLLNRNQRFTGKIKAAIDHLPGSRVFTKARYVFEYDDYVESRVGAVLSDESIPLERRSGLLYGQASKVVKDLFVEGVNQKSLEQAGRYAGHLANFLYSDPKALRTMMALTINDYYTFTHSIHVSIYGLGLYLRTLSEGSACSAEDVAMGLLFHDVGKSRIDSAILKKRGPLDPGEWYIIKQHPIFGRDLLEKNGLCHAPVIEIVLAHHEKLNGQGYPQGLRGGEISALAQVACIADIFDAITTNRPYKKALRPFEALVEMKDQNGNSRLFDRDLFEVFVRMMAE